jgi:hypothetical protein
VSDSFVGLPPDDVGKKVDTEQLVVGVNTVQRERDQIAGKGAAEIAEVRNDAPNATDHGLVVRTLPPVSASAHLDYVTSASLAAGASVNLDATTIPAATTGKLLGVTVGASVAARWVVKTRDGGVEVVKAVLFTSGVTGGFPSLTWRAASKEMIPLAGAGVDENFRITATSLDAFQAADVHVSFEWDE